jgi:hypothetical protein
MSDWQKMSDLDYLCHSKHLSAGGPSGVERNLQKSNIQVDLRAGRRQRRACLMSWELSNRPCINSLPLLRHLKTENPGQSRIN